MTSKQTLRNVSPVGLLLLDTLFQSRYVETGDGGGKGGAGKGGKGGAGKGGKGGGKGGKGGGERRR